MEYDPVTQALGELHLDHVSLPFVGDERRFRHFDSLGNVSFVTDEFAAVTSHRRYHPFGVDEVYGDDDFQQGEVRGFVGGIGLRHNGVDTGLVVLGARVLDSDVGRFLSRDPVLQLTNQYTYAEGNPVERIDADGRHPEPKSGGGSSSPDLATQLHGFAVWTRVVASGTALTAFMLAAEGEPGAALAAGVGLGFGFAGALADLFAEAIRATRSLIRCWAF